MGSIRLDLRILLAHTPIVRNAVLPIFVAGADCRAFPRRAVCPPPVVSDNINYRERDDQPPGRALDV